jgi:hypothetical protein
LDEEDIVVWDINEGQSLLPIEHWCWLGKVIQLGGKSKYRGMIG